VFGRLSDGARPGVVNHGNKRWLSGRVSDGARPGVVTHGGRRWLLFGRVNDGARPGVVTHGSKQCEVDIGWHRQDNVSGWTYKFLQGAKLVGLQREKNLRLRDHVAVGFGKRIDVFAVVGRETRCLARKERKTKFCMNFGD